MTYIEFLKKAYEGGWTPEWEETRYSADGGTQKAMVNMHKVLLDVLAWQAVGKVEDWGHEMKGNGIPMGTYPETMIHILMHKENKLVPVWRFYMHRMIDALCEGKSIEQFLETLDSDDRWKKDIYTKTWEKAV